LQSKSRLYIIPNICLVGKQYTNRKINCVFPNIEHMLTIYLLLRADSKIKCHTLTNGKIEPTQFSYCQTLLSYRLLFGFMFQSNLFGINNFFFFGDLRIEK
jgi:hypothetical protein